MAERLRADGHEVHFVGAPGGPEAGLAREAGLAFHALPARGFDRSRPASLVGAAGVLAVSTIRAIALLGRLRPGAVAGFGGYVSLPVGLAASVRRIPLILHEQNSVPGVANRVLARFACAIGVTYAETGARLGRSRRTEVTGNPVRDAIVSADRIEARRQMDLSDDDVLLLAFGGSRGARHLNETLVALAPRICARPWVRVVHVAGAAEYESVRSAADADTLTAAERERYHVVSYLDDMGQVLAAADVVVARAGATSIAEITAVGRAAVLVPYPYATGDHQTKNAEDVAKAGGAIVIADSDLDAPVFEAALLSLLDDAEARESMARASRGLGRVDAADRFAALVRECASPARTGA